VVISAVAATLHGEVASLAKLSATKTLALTQPANSLYMLTFPRVALAAAAADAPVADITLAAGDASAAAGDAFAPTLTVQTSPTSDQSLTRVAMLKFKPSARPSKVVSAVLQLTVVSVQGARTAQVLTVLGSTAPWAAAEASWNSVPGLLRPQPMGAAVNSIADNFIKWGEASDASSPQILGHLTLLPEVKAGTVVQLDVTDYVRRGGDTYALARLWRFDKRGSGPDALPGDALGGAITFASREAAKGSPLLRVVYAR
jgi:hypothetical protein